MRDKTINPNPPICRSKEPSFTFATIYSCADNSVLDRIQHYNWNITEANAAANGGLGTYTQGYFYETAFKKYTSLDQNHCIPKNYFSWQFGWSSPNLILLQWQCMGTLPEHQGRMTWFEDMMNYPPPEIQLAEPIISYTWTPHNNPIIHIEILTNKRTLFSNAHPNFTGSGWTPRPPQGDNFVPTDPPPYP